MGQVLVCSPPSPLHSLVHYPPTLSVAQVMYKRRDYDAAMTLFKDALDIRKVALGFYHPATYKSMMWVAETRRRANSVVSLHASTIE